MKYTRIRNAEPRDIPILMERLWEQNDRDGTCYPLPVLFDEDGRLKDNIPLALVVEHAGRVDGGIIFESKGVEMMLVGCHPRVTILAQEEQRGIEYTLRKLGFRWIRCLVTKLERILEDLEPVMEDAGFSRDDTRFASFFKEL